VACKADNFDNLPLISDSDGWQLAAQRSSKLKFYDVFGCSRRISSISMGQKNTCLVVRGRPRSGLARTSKQHETMFEGNTRIERI
jgi:hypothetical protein